MTEREGFTFAMSIMGMKARDWREVLDYTVAGVQHFNISSIVNYFNNTLGFTSAALTWGADQVSKTFSPFFSIKIFPDYPVLQYPTQRILFTTRK